MVSRGLHERIINDVYVIFVSDSLYKSICCWVLIWIVEAIQMSTTTYAFIKSRYKYVGCNLKTTKLLECGPIGVCAVIRSNTVYLLQFLFVFLLPKQTVFVGDILFSHCPSIHMSVHCSSVLLSPHFTKKKGGYCVTPRPSVCPSVHTSGTFGG